MNILTFPDPILRERMPEFNFENPIMDPKELEKTLVEKMLTFNGIGLAANQIGIRTRVFAMGHSDYPDAAQAFFNPSIIANTDTIVDMEEGCLSFPGVFVKIKRPSKIKARWQDSLGNWQEDEFDGYNCKCFLHELDHLEGIVFKDRVSQLKWALAIKNTQKGKKYNVRTK